MNYALVDKKDSKHVYEVSESYFTLFLNKFLTPNSKIIKYDCKECIEKKERIKQHLLLFCEMNKR